MKAKRTFKQRVISGFIAIAMIFTIIPFSLLTALAANGDTHRVADPSTMDDWKNYFPISGDITTENAGKVWMDKSVLLDASLLGNGISKKDPDSFLVALSTIASSMSIKGMSNVPTDSIFILDVSGSMDNTRNDVAEELVEAANTSIGSLLATNEHNRIAVVLYSGSSTTMLPLGRYSTASDGKYLTYTVNRGEETIGIDYDVRIEGTNTRPSSRTRNVTGGTYIQAGISEALDIFTDTKNTTTVNDAVAGTIKRMPVMVLMSDGAPTYGTSSFTNPGDYNIGDGTKTSAALGFVTQLTAAYAKAKIEEKYDNESLFYTLGLGIGNDSVALAVMDPQNPNASTAVDDFWNSKKSLWNGRSFDGYNNISVGQTVSVGNGRTVTKIATELEQYYVDKYFSAEEETLSDGTVVTMADKLKAAFADIVSEIQLQSAYFPTLIKDSEDHSGFVSFVDKIGEYMEVTDVKGILIHDDLFSGADLASNFVSDGGALGTFDNPSELGKKMVEAVTNRLGLESEEVAAALIELAYRNGQLYYNNANDFSNYIGWYANASGDFLGFYHEGVTKLPEATGNVDTDPVFIIRSYGYLGEVDVSHGVSESDMMFATVQVRKNINTDEEIVTFAVPAALIPIVNYEVTLDENSTLTELTVKGATAPIRLVYEVALRSDINEFNVLEKVSSEYLSDVHNRNADGSVNFYSNKWDHSNTTGYNTINTYGYFNPSKQNDSYYYTEDTIIYSDTNGTVYKSTDAPVGDKYYAYSIYKNNGGLKTETIYRKIDPLVLASAGKNADNTWYVPKGSVHVYLGNDVEKTENKTGTLENALMPFVDTYNHTINDEGYFYYVGATLGNNGKITVTPETGVKITKVMGEGTQNPDTAFNFYITDLNGTTAGKAYPALFVDANGVETEMFVIFNSQGIATVSLKAGETVYIGGMNSNEAFHIEEGPSAEYVSTVTGLEPDGKITPVSQTILPVKFTNTKIGKGSVIITKEVEHDYGTNYELPTDLEFSIKVTLSGLGTANTTFETKMGDVVSSVRTDDTGSFETMLKHGEIFEIFGIPENTTVTVVEQNVPNGFTPAYEEDGVVGDGIVTVIKDAKVSVDVLNSYEAAPVYPVPVINVNVEKTLTGRDWQNGDEFTFELQKYLGNNSWQTLGSVKVTSDSTVTFSDVFSTEVYSAIGTYYYRIVEIEPDVNPIPGIAYDKNVHSFSVVVTDNDMDGKLEISDVHSDRDVTKVNKNGDQYDITASFENKYFTSGSATVTVEVNKAINNIGGADKSLAGYEFGLFNASGNLVGTTLKTTDRGFVRFVLTYSAEDINASEENFTYTLREIHPTVIPDGWSYSTKEVKINVDVVDNLDGTISAYVYTTENRPADATDSIAESFVNEYDPDDAELIVDFVSKELEGRDQVKSEFNFEIRGVTDPSMKPIKGSNTQDGKVVFDSSLKIGKVGTYVYNIVETGNDINGLKLDKTVYRVVVTVVDDGDGQLTASYIVTNDADDKIVFKNTYTPKPVTNSVKGNKELVGRPLLNDEFTFVLTEYQIDGVDVTSPKSYETNNLITGAFEFEEITYTKKGTYTYKVTEKTPEGHTFGVEYDKTVFIYTVVIKDDGMGTLSVESQSVALENGAAPDGLTFVNVYSADKTSATINGNKTLTGKVDNALKGNEYEFELYESNANWEYSENTLKETVANQAGGIFEFTKIDFETEEDKYYIVVEKNGGQKINGVTYDSTVYRVFVEVTDDHRGQLHAKLHIYDGDGIPQDSINFINVYEITGGDEVVLSGEKTLDGRDWTNSDEFKFELYEANSSFATNGSAIKTDKVTSTDRKFDLKLEYTPSDVGKTYYYVLKEEYGGQSINGVTYSRIEYYITVIVSDNGDGTIKTVATVENATTSTLNFVNVYAVTGKADVTLAGEKTLDGREFADDDKFTFELYKADSSFVISGDAVKTADVGKADHSFEIKLEYLPSDIGNTYYYVLKEMNAGKEIGNITYSNVEYHVTVVVSDNGDGMVKAVATVENAAADKLDFVNVFVPDPDNIKVDVNIDKTVVNKGAQLMGPDGFEFILDPELDGEADIKVKTDKDGKAVITLEFDKDDIGKTFKYKLSEINSGIKFVKYSEKEYAVDISVTHDKATNKLVAEIKVDDNEVDKINASFENVYEPEIPESPQTGVRSNIGMWAVMLFISGGAVITLSAFDSKKKSR